MGKHINETTAQPNKHQSYLKTEFYGIIWAYIFGFLLKKCG